MTLLATVMHLSASFTYEIASDIILSLLIAMVVAAGDSILQSCRRLCAVLGAEQTNRAVCDGSCRWAVVPAVSYPVHARSHRNSTWWLPWTSAHQGQTRTVSSVLLVILMQVVFMTLINLWWSSIMHSSIIALKSWSCRVWGNHQLITGRKSLSVHMCYVSKVLLEPCGTLAALICVSVALS